MPSSDHDDVPRLGPTHGGDGNGTDECRQPSAILHCKCQQVNVGELLRSEDMSLIKLLRIGEGNTIRPKRMIGVRNLLGKQVERCPYRNRT